MGDNPRAKARGLSPHTGGQTIFLVRTYVVIYIRTPSTRVRGYKTFPMLNSAEHEILNAHTYKNIKKFIIFQAQISLECYFFLLINVKMPTIVGILTFMNCCNIYEQEKFPAQFS